MSREVNELKTHKARMSVNIPRFMQTLTHQGDLLSELVKNAIEATGCTRVDVWLNREKRTLVIRNDGEPVADPEKYLLEIFTTGKDENLHHGKGGSTVLMEESAEWRTGIFLLVENAWNDVDVQEGLENVPGCTVTVHLKEDSPLFKVEDETHYAFLCRFRTTKKLFFNYQPVTTRPLPDMSKWSVVMTGLHAMIAEKREDDGNWFMLSDGSYAPIEVSNSPACSLIISHVQHLDTERGKLGINSQWRLDAWYKEEVRRSLGDKKSETLADWLNKTFAPWLTGFFETIETRDMQDVDFTGITFSEASHLQYIITRLNDVAKRFKYPEFTWGTGLDDLLSKTVTMMRSDNWYYSREVFTKYIGDPLVVMRNLSIGVMIANGEVVGDAKVKDLPVAGFNIVDITDRELWVALKQIEGPLIAFHIDMRFVIDMHEADLSTLKQETARIAAPKSEDIVSVSPAEVMEEDDGSIRAGDARDYPAGEELGEDEPDYKLFVKDGVKFLVHKSRDFERMRLRMGKQRFNFEQWKAAICTIMRFTKFAKQCVPVIGIKAKDESVYSVAVGPYIALDYHTSLPNNKTNRMFVLTLLGVHELAHLLIPQHTQKFRSLVEDTCLKLSWNERYMAELRGALP